MGLGGAGSQCGGENKRDRRIKHQLMCRGEPQVPSVFLRRVCLVLYGSFPLLKRQGMANVLTAYAYVNPATGYCQSLATMAMLLLLVLREEV